MRPRPAGSGGSSVWRGSADIDCEPRSDGDNPANIACRRGHHDTRGDDSPGTPQFITCARNRCRHPAASARKGGRRDADNAVRSNAYDRDSPE